MPAGSDDTHLRVGNPGHDPATFAPGHRPPTGLVVLVGGVGELFQTDLDAGRHVIETLMAEPVPAGVYVEDLSYGAIPFTHRLQELEPDVLVLVGATQRGLDPGTVHRRVVDSVERTPEELQGAVGDAYVGYVDLDLAIDVAHALGPLPSRTVLVEVEAAATGPSTSLTPVVADAIGRAVAAVRREIRTAPLFDALGRLRVRLEEGALGPSAIRDALVDLVAALDAVDAADSPWSDGWGRVEAARVAVSRAVAASLPGEGMDHGDWGLSWGLVEEIERLRPLLLEDHPDPG